MTRDEIRAKLIEIIHAETPYKGEVTDDMRLLEDIGADSLQLMAIVAAAEAAFGTSIPDEALLDLQTVGDAVDFVEGALAG